MAKSSVEFVSYDGQWPNLCSGELVVRIDGEIHKFNYCLHSGGSVWFDDDWDAHVEDGPWEFEGPEGMGREIELAIQEVVNENVPWGCCGGCV